MEVRLINKTIRIFNKLKKKKHHYIQQIKSKIHSFEFLFITEDQQYINIQLTNFERQHMI